MYVGWVGLVLSVTIIFFNPLQDIFELKLSVWNAHIIWWYHPAVWKTFLFLKYRN